jgi:predicted dehydrogenase
MMDIHMHEPIAMAAMALGKHIYVQKPMAQTIAGALTEVVLAGAIAQRLPGQRLVYEPEHLRFRGNDQATALIHHSLPG